MSRLDELYTNICNYVTEFQTNHQTYVTHGNKAAGTRARKAIGEVKKLVTEYRKESVSASK
jgi:hypothetical protein